MQRDAPPSRAPQKQGSSGGGCPGSAQLFKEDCLLCSEQLTQNPPGGGEGGGGVCFCPQVRRPAPPLGPELGIKGLWSWKEPEVAHHRGVN